MTEQAGRSRRSVVFVAGSGRSGTSLFSGILQRLGYTVPQPEVKPDDSNPKGFAESRWVVDFHTRLLRTAHVQTADARPGAWTDAAAAGTDAVAEELQTFLAGELSTSDHVLVKDPRLVWFLPLWRRVAIDLGVTPRFVTMLRHPAEVVDSKGRHYGARLGELSRTAGWINTMLYTERATREGQRAFVRYDDLLGDWPKAVHRVADVLDLHPVASATAAQIRTAEAFVDPSLRRSSSSWDDMAVPTELREHAERVWDMLARLADPDGGAGDELSAELDEVRESYVLLYEGAEGIAQSSIIAAGRRGARAKQASKVAVPARRSLARRAWRRLPKPLKGVVRAVLRRKKR